ncbi:acyl carrier protein [Brevibacillus dissolubilis]|uniref:acyl carrier protein n=1 Tax=Brevibacillus dissolubilis TaxID=1844116 RepID=UPI001116D09C|nr:acyl carrier protein [Brevibacillus dissolubilis]
MSIEQESTLQKLVNEVLEREGNGEDISMNANLGEIGLHSITFVKLVVQIETTFGIEFANEDLIMEKYETLRDLLNYVQQKLER